MEKKTRGLLFSADMFLFLARKYGFVLPNLPLYSSITKTESDFTDHIGEAILVLAYSYRPVFRARMKDVFPLTVNSKDNMHLYVSTFAKITCRCFSPYRFLVVCCFVSELCLYRFYNAQVENPYKEYIELAMDCFRTAYEHVLMKKLNHTTGWRYLKRIGELLAPGYELLSVFVIDEHPNNPTPFAKAFAKVYVGIGSDVEFMRTSGRKPAGSSLPTKASSEKDSSKGEVVNEIPLSSKEPEDQEKNSKSKNRELATLDKESAFGTSQTSIHEYIPSSLKALAGQEKFKSESKNQELATVDRESASGSAETYNPWLYEQNIKSESGNEESYEPAFSFGTVSEALGVNWMEEFGMSSDEF